MNLVRHELGSVEDQGAISKKGYVPCHLFARGQFRARHLSRSSAKQFPWCIEWEAELGELFREYVAAKQRQNVLDYDDLLLYWAEMMKVEELAEEIGGRFDHVLVDEYQDTNRLQAKILLN